MPPRNKSPWHYALSRAIFIYSIIIRRMSNASACGVSAAAAAGGWKHKSQPYHYQKKFYLRHKLYDAWRGTREMKQRRFAARAGGIGMVRILKKHPSAVFAFCLV